MKRGNVIYKKTFNSREIVDLINAGYEVSGDLKSARRNTETILPRRACRLSPRYIKETVKQITQ